MPEDRELEGDELGARVDAQPLAQGLARSAERCQGVGLAAVAVQGPGEEAPATLAEGLGGHQGLRLRRDAAEVPGGQAGVEQVLLGGPPEVLEPGGLDARR